MTLRVEPTGSYNINKGNSIGEKSKYPKFGKIENSSDEFVKIHQEDASNDGKFTGKEALKNFGKGLISPIVAMIKHPIATLATLVGVGAACFAVPVLTPILTLGFGALSLYHLGKSTFNTIKDYSNGNYDNAEKGFKGIGEGVVGTLTTMLGLKSSAKIAAEAKAISVNGAKALDAATKKQIATQIAEGGFSGAIKEHFSIVFTKNGWKAILNQLKPSSIKDRFTALFTPIKKINNNIPKKESTIEKFKKSQEGIRRANLSDKQIETEIQNKFMQAFDELGIPKEQRPKLQIVKDSELRGGSYNSRTHVIKINPESYKAGVFELDDVLMHEATHCREALLRSGLPQDKVNQMVADDLIARISGGENEQIIVSGGFMQVEMMKAPKLPNGLKKDFIAFAKKNLYNLDDNFNSNLRNYVDAKSSVNNNYSSQPLVERMANVEAASKKITSFLDELNSLLDKHPEFLKNYKSREEAVYVLEQYALSHNTRYRWLTNNTIKGVTPPKLTPEQVKLAEKSLRGKMDTMEGNAANSGFNNIFGDSKKFNQYQFSPEEVLAQQNGNNFVIKNYRAKLAELRKNGTLTPETEAYLTGAIKRAENIIAYKNKGLEYYELYRQAINHPSDKVLAAKVASLKKELQVLHRALTPEDAAKVQKFLSASCAMPSNWLPTMSILID